MRGSEHHAPTDEQALATLVADAAAAGMALEVCGRRSKRGFGRPSDAASRLSLSQMTGITYYEPGERIIAARPGTLLSVIEATLASRGQELAFEPCDLAHATMPGPAMATIGGTIAANVSGARARSVGTARDAVLGVRLVNGRGEILRAGGRVMHHGAGLGFQRLLAGSWGTLGVLSEITLRVAPKAEDLRTLILLNLSDEAAVSALGLAMGLPVGATATLHVPRVLVSRLAPRDVANLGQSVTAVRLEGAAQSLPSRIEKLHGLLKAFGEVYELDSERSAVLWDDVRGLNFAAGKNPLWRIAVAPGRAAGMVAAAERRMECVAAYEWAGAQVWLEVPPNTDANAIELRRIIAEFGGNATLVRAEPATRALVDVLQPMPEAVMAVVRRMKAAFDPAGILNPGRLYLGV